MKKKVLYVADVVYDPGDCAQMHMLPQCPECMAYPTYNESFCPFCGQELEYPESEDGEE